MSPPAWLSPLSPRGQGRVRWTFHFEKGYLVWQSHQLSPLCCAVTASLEVTSLGSLSSMAAPERLSCLHEVSRSSLWALDVFLWSFR